MQMKLPILLLQKLFLLAVVLISKLGDPLLQTLVVLRLLSQLLNQVWVLLELILANLLKSLDLQIQLVRWF